MATAGGTVFGTAKAIITLDIGGVISGARQASAAFNSITSSSAQMSLNSGRSLRSMSEAATGISRGLGAISLVSGAIGAGVAAGLGKAATEFINFDTVVHNIGSLGKDAAASIGELTPKIFSLAEQLGKSPTELADALYTVASAGFSTQDSLTIITASTRAAVAGLTDVGTAADLISSALLSYGETADQAEHVSNVLFATVQIGKVRFEDLARTLGILLPVAKAAGVSLEEVGAAMAALTNQGLSARQASQQLNSLFQSLIKPSAALSDALRQNGFESGQALIAAKGLGGALDFLSQITNGNATAMAKLLTNQRAARAAFLLTGDGAKQYADALAATTAAQEGTGATQKSLDEQMKSTSFAIAQAKASLDVFLIQIGSKLGPTITTAAHYMGLFLQAVSATFTFLDKFGLATPIILLTAFVGVVATAIATFSAFAIVIIRVVESLNAYQAAAAEAAAASAGLAATTATASTAMAGTSTAAATVGKSWGLLKALGPIALAVTFAFPILADALEKSRHGGETIADGWAIGIAHGLAHIPLIGNPIGDWAKGQVDAFSAEKIALKLGLTIDDGGILERKTTTATIKELGQTMDEVTAAAKRNNQSVEEYILAQLKANGTTSDAIKLAQKQIDQQGMSADEIAAQDAQIQQQAQEYQDLSDVIDSLGKKVTKTDQAFIDAKGAAGLILPLSETADQFKQFTSELDQLVSDTKAKLGSITSVADPLSFLTSQIDKTSTTVSGLFLRMHDLGVGIDFTPAEVQALKLNETMENVDNHLKSVGDAITQNSNDISMWQQRISLVDSVLGDGTDTLADYNNQLFNGEITQKAYNKAVEDGSAHVANANLVKLYNDGKLSLKEYNDALEAGIHIRARSLGGIEDEQAAQAKLLPVLDRWITAHDNADHAINKLSDDQKAFLSVLNDTNTGQALATVQMVSYLASIGQVPQAAVTKIVTDFGDSDPKLHALFAELGLLKDPVTIQVKANIDQATQKLHDIGVQKDALLAQQATLQIEVAEDPTNEATRKKLKDTQDAITALDGRQATISTAIKSGDDAKVKAAIADDQKAVDTLNATPVAPGSTAPPTAAAAGTGGVTTAPTVTIPIATQVLNPDGSPSNSGVQGVIDGLTADIQSKQADVSVGVVLGPPPLDHINQVITDAETKLNATVRGVVTTLDNMTFDTSTDEGFKELQNHIRDLQNQRIDIQVAVKDPDKAQFDTDVSDQVALLQASRDRIVAALQEQANHPGIINDLSQTQSIVVQKIAALKAVANPSTQQLQDLQALQTYLLEINEQLAMPKDFQISDAGAAKALDLMKRVAALTGAVVEPKDITIDTDRARAAVLDLQNQIVTVDGNIKSLRDSANNGDADAKAKLAAAIAQRDALVSQKAIIAVTMDSSQFTTEASKIDARIQDEILTAQHLKQALASDPNNQSLNDQINVSDATIQRLEQSKLLLEAIASGDPSAAFAKFSQEFTALGVQIGQNPLFESLKPEQWTPDMNALFERYKALGALVADANGQIDQTKFNADLKAVLAIQTQFLGSPDDIAAAKAALHGGALPGATAPITPTVKQQQLIDELNKIKAGAAALNAQGQVEFKANGLREAQAALHTMRGDAALTLDDFKSIDFNINGEHTSAFTNFLNETHDKLGETFGPKYTAFLDANGDGVITNTDLAKKGLEDIAKRWTAFISADSTTAQDTIDFIEQRLVDLGNPELTGGGHGIDIKANADEALAVIKGLNTKIDDSKLNGTLLTTLDANGDGFLDAVELARVTGKDLADTKFVADLEIKTKGEDAAKTTIQDVKNVTADLTSNPGVVQITAKSDADVQKFLDANQTALTGKTVSVTVTNPDGSIKSIEEFQFSGKSLTVSINDTEFQTFLNATIELDQDGVTFDVIADDAQAAQTLLDINAKKLAGKNVQVFIKDEATGQLELIDQKKLPDKSVKVAVDKTAVDDLDTNGANKTVTVDANTKPATDAAAAAPQQVQDAIDKQPAPVITLTTQVASGAGAATGAGFPVGGGSSFGDFGASAAAAASAAISSVLTALAALPAQMSVAGQNAGQAFDLALLQTLSAAPTYASLATSGLISFLASLESATYNPGFNVGFNFDYGIAGGIAAGSSVIQNAASYAALVAYYAAKSALGIHSPSTLGHEIGGFFDEGIADGVTSKADQTARAARNMALRMADEFSAVKAKPMTLTSILGAAPGASPSDVAAARKTTTIPGLTQVANGISFGGVVINVPGAGDPKTVASEVYRKLIDAANRQSAGGTAG